MILSNNLIPQIKKNKSKYIKLFDKVISTGILINGKSTFNLEKNLNKYFKTKYCLTCGNGTDALEIAFKSLDLNSHDKVFIAANAGMYSATSLNQLKINAKYFDIEKEFYGPSLEIIKNLRQKPRAIIVTHLYGKINPDINKISFYCKKNKILLIEDCAQAIGTSLNQKKAGTFGDVATFSFFPTKNLFGIGDGGAIIFKSKKIFNNAKMIKQYGWKKKYYVSKKGGQNSRMDEINAEIINYNLFNLNKNNLKRYEIAKIYSLYLNNKNIIVPKIIQKNQCNYHLFIIFVKKNRQKLINYLIKNNIYPQVHYPLPDHKQSINLKKYKKLKLPVTENLAKEILTLPCYPDLNKKDVIKISKIINNWV